jgi:hypothetical protein
MDPVQAVQDLVNENRDLTAKLAAKERECERMATRITELANGKVDAESRTFDALAKLAAAEKRLAARGGLANRKLRSECKTALRWPVMDEDIDDALEDEIKQTVGYRGSVVTDLLRLLQRVLRGDFHAEPVAATVKESLTVQSDTPPAACPDSEMDNCMGYDTYARPNPITPPAAHAEKAEWLKWVEKLEHPDDQKEPCKCGDEYCQQATDPASSIPEDYLHAAVCATDNLEGANKRIANLEKQLDACRKDAERWRWVKSHNATVDLSIYGQQWCVWHNGRWTDKFYSADEAIDAAMAQEEK